MASTTPLSTPSAQRFAGRPKPEFNWNPYADLHTERWQLQNSSMQILFGKALILSVTEKHTNRDVVRIDRTLDLKEMAKTRRNAKIWLEKVGMPSKFAKPDDGFATIRKDSASEYMIIPEHLEMRQCHSLSLAWKARLPNTLMDLVLLSEANVTKEVWILAKQETNDSETSLKFDHRTLIPAADPLPTCKAYYSKASKIQEISFSQASQNHYTWWDATLSSYHVENHLQLEVAMHPHLESCSIFVANPSEFTNSPDAKQACALIRDNTHNRFRTAITEDQFQQTK